MSSTEPAGNYAWHLCPSGCVPVLIRGRGPDGTASVSLMRGPRTYIDGRLVRGWSPRTKKVAIPDLFHNHDAALVAFRARYGTHGRRRAA